MARRSASVEVEGLRELQKRIGQLKDVGLKRELRDVNRQAGEIVKQDAQPDVPVDTGRLRRTLRVRAEMRGASVILGGPRAVYAPVIHWGWKARGIKARPAVYQAFGRNRRRIIDNYRDRLRALAKKVNR